MFIVYAFLVFEHDMRNGNGYCDHGPSNFRFAIRAKTRQDQRATSANVVVYYANVHKASFARTSVHKKHVLCKKHGFCDLRLSFHCAKRPKTHQGPRARNASGRAFRQRAHTTPCIYICLTKTCFLQTKWIK